MQAVIPYHQGQCPIGQAKIMRIMELDVVVFQSVMELVTRTEVIRMTLHKTNVNKKSIVSLKKIMSKNITKTMDSKAVDFVAHNKDVINTGRLRRRVTPSLCSSHFKAIIMITDTPIHAAATGFTIPTGPGQIATVLPHPTVAAMGSENTTDRAANTHPTSTVDLTAAMDPPPHQYMGRTAAAVMAFQISAVHPVSKSAVVVITSTTIPQLTTKHPRQPPTSPPRSWGKSLTFQSAIPGARFGKGISFISSAPVGVAKSLRASWLIGRPTGGIQMICHLFPAHGT
mmetsp:Transcript_56378/g.76881  ORF Transcript_56378/g.76881 Transcript_56378/m.76881 type:complete len:285 (+) Transcript_56378:1037-1891(+)